MHERKGDSDFSLSLQALIPLDPNTPEPAWRSAWMPEMPSLWKPSTQTLTVSWGWGSLPGAAEGVEERAGAAVGVLNCFWDIVWRSPNCLG